MDQSAIRTDIFTYLAANWSATPIAYPNHSFEDTDDAWIRPSIKMASAIYGDTVIDEEYGILFIDVFVPQKTGTLVAFSHADDLRVLFRRKSLSDIYFDSVSIIDLGEVSLFYQVQVQAHFLNFLA